MMPLIILDRVVLPPPETPTRPKISPSLISRLTLSTALTTPRSMLMYLLARPLALIMGAPSSTSSLLPRVPAMARNLAAISVGLPSALISPSSRSMALSVSSIITSSQWLVMTRVMWKSLTALLMDSCTTLAVAGSSVPVGSSARRIMGDLASWRARTTLCFSPPDSSLATCIKR